MDLSMKLGQRVYGVTRSGQIVPTLVSEIELFDSKLTQSDFERSFDIALSGERYSADARFSFRTLYSDSESIHLSFDDAYEAALLKLEVLVHNEMHTVRQQIDLQEWHKRLLNDKSGVEKEISDITTFSKSRELNLLGQDENAIYKASDFPKTYIEPGTPVWIADTKNYND